MRMFRWFLLAVSSVALLPVAHAHTVSLQRVFDMPPVTEPNQVAKLSPFTQIGGSINAIAASGSLVYVNEGSKFVVIDIADVARPVRRGVVPLDFQAYSILIVENLAYVLDLRGQLYLIDVRDPDKPTLSSKLGDSTAVSFMRFAIADKRIYALQGDGKLSIFDVSNPANPRQLASTDLPDARDIQVRDNLAYVMTKQGLRILDVRNPSVPTTVGSFAGIAAANMLLSGNFLYLLDYGHLQIVDVRVPSAPALRGWLPVSGTLSQLIGQRLYILSGDGILAVDVGDPQNPLPTGECQPIYGLAGFVMTPEATYAALNWRGWASIDIRTCSDGLTPQARTGGTDGPLDQSAPVVESYSGFGGVGTIIADGTHAYAVMGNRIQIFDLDDVVGLVPRGTYRNTLGTGQMQIVGQTLYATDEGYGLLILDVSNPDLPVLLGRFPARGFARGVTVADGRAYITGYNENLEIVDVSNPAAPKLLSTAEVYQGVSEVSGGIVYVAALGSLVVIDVRGSVPIQIGYLRLPGVPHRIQRVGDRLYIAAERELQIVDISTPTNPTLVEGRTAEGAYGLQVIWPYAYGTFGQSGFQIYDIRTPPDLILRGQYAVWSKFVYSEPGDVAIMGGRAYVGRGNAGVDIVNIPPTMLPPSGTITQNGGVLASDDERIRVEVRAGTLAESAVFSYGEQAPFAPPPEARQRLIHTFTLEARGLDGQAVDQFTQPLSLQIAYERALLRQQRIEESSLYIARWDGQNWRTLAASAACTGSRAERFVRCTDEIGTFALIGSTDENTYIPIVRQPELVLTP